MKTRAPTQDELTSLWNEIGTLAEAIEHGDRELSAADQCAWLYDIMTEHGWEIT